MDTLHRVLLVLAAASLGLVCLAAPAAAQIDGPCTATIAGEDVESARSPATAIEVDHDEIIQVSGTDATGAPFTRIQLRFEPFASFTVYDEPNDPPDETWGGEVEVADYAIYGVGLYQVRGSTDDCTGTAWVRVTGRSPLTTLAGGIGLALLVLGAVGAGIGIARARPGFTSLLRTILAGLPLGLGLAVLAQQFGVTPLTGGAIAGWTGAAASTSGLSHLLVTALRAGPTLAAT